jgi:mono/diheme cytochrome c family protein
MTDTTRRNSAGLLRQLLAAGLLIAASRGAGADEAGEVRAGQVLAIKACSPCHVVSEPVGPPFAEIAKGPRATPDSLRDFLRSTHADVSHPHEMPNPEVTERQIDDLAAYIESLRPAK